MAAFCPCGSGQTYAACCRPYHRGGEPKSPEALMRSRFSAYALGEAPYLYRTLHSAHPDHAAGEAALVRSVRQARQALKYVRLEVLDADGGGEEGRVLFHAEIYEKGRERSFAELSRFVRQGGAWRYLGGEARPMSASDAALAELNISRWSGG